MLDIKELLALRNLDINKKIKLVRHLDTRRIDLHHLHQEELLNLYQCYQSNPVFDKCEYVVSFLGIENSKAKLIGVYKVNERKLAVEKPLPSNFKYPEIFPPNGYYYELEPVNGFEDLNGRVVINWGGSTLAWHQWLTEKEIIEILPVGYVKNFPGYLDFILTFDELVNIINYLDANRDWHTMLGAVAGIYLIVDTKTGKQYVGSAYGVDGILGRWTEYAKSLHGGNIQLQQLLKDDSSYAKNFQYTILQTLPKTLTKTEVIEYETLYKRKLGTRVFGLNSN